MPRIGIISNPFAKMNKKNPEYNTRLWYILGNHGQFEITRSLTELENVCQEFHARKIDYVGIVGGDGSISLVLSYLAKAYGPDPLPKILLLKGGTINFLAANLGIRAQGAQFLSDFLKRIEKNKPVYETRLSTIQVEDRLGFIFANAASSAFLEEYYKNKTGHFGAALKISTYILDGLFCGKINGKFYQFVKHYPMRITTEPTPWEQGEQKNKPFKGYTLLFVSTVPRLPFGIHMFKNVKCGENFAEIVAVTEKGFTLLKEAGKTILTWQLNRSNFTQSLKIENAVIECERNSSYSLDGDLVESRTGKIHIHMGPSFVFCSPYRMKV